MIELFLVLVLIVVGFTFGVWAEQRHLASLASREAANGLFLVTQLKTFPGHSPGSQPPQIVVAETVVATDYFKTFLANLRGLFGGEVQSYHSLLSRARRETTQRLVEQAQQLGFDAICNLRLETADVGGSSASKKSAAMVAILGCATAYHFDCSNAGSR
ncbi:MAG: YbjQ family protein [Pirellulales bacterium]|nr:YbjQ family protein [Pirellulales bacterium]